MKHREVRLFQRTKGKMVKEKERNMRGTEMRMVDRWYMCEKYRRRIQENCWSFEEEIAFKSNQNPKADRVYYLNVGNGVAGWCALSSFQKPPSEGRGLVGLLTLENGNKWQSAKGTTTKCPWPSQVYMWCQSAAPCIRQKSRGSNLTLIPKCGKARQHFLKGPKGNISSAPRWLDNLSLWGREGSWLAWMAMFVHVEECKVRKWAGPSFKSLSVSFSFNSQ